MGNVLMSRKNQTAYDAAKTIIGRPRWQIFGIASQIFMAVYLFIDMFHHVGPHGGGPVIPLSFTDSVTVMGMLSPAVFVAAGILPVKYLLTLRRLVREIDEERARNNSSNQ